MSRIEIRCGLLFGVGILLAMVSPVQAQSVPPCSNVTRHIQDPLFAPGQQWSYRSRPEDIDSTLFIMEVDQVPELGAVIWVAVEHFHVPALPLGRPERFANAGVAITREALLASGIQRIDSPPSMFGPNYEAWVRDCINLTYNTPIADTLNTLEHIRCQDNAKGTGQDPNLCPSRPRYPASEQTAAPATTPAPTCACPTTVVQAHYRPYIDMGDLTEVQTQADGTAITVVTPTQEWRDDVGREREDIFRTLPDGTRYRDISVYDPVEQVRMAWSVGKPNTLDNVTVYPFPRIATAPSAQGPAPANSQPDRRYIQQRTETLPPQVIAGLYAEGVLRTSITSAGTQGNDHDLITTQETWTSPDTGIQLRNLTVGPPFGKIGAEMTSIQFVAPDPAVFKAPEGYEVIYASPKPAPAAAPTCNCPTPTVTPQHVKPYSYKIHNTHVQTLADGTTITTVTTSQIWRDADGRTRQESFGTGTNGTLGHSININDPVARVRLNWVVDNPNVPKVVNLTHYPSPGVQSAQPPPVNPPSVQRRYYPTRTESLPPQTIDGLYATGSRTTRTTPAGYEGNDRDITVTTETWTSPDLGIQLRRISDDPRTGKTTYEITDVQQTAPDPALFKAPDGYQAGTSLRGAESENIPLNVGCSPLSRALDGEWKNVDTATRYLKRIIVSGATMHPYASCGGGGECDWGVLPAQCFASSIESRDLISMMAASDKNSIRTLITVTLESHGRLRIQGFDTFSNGDRRSNFSKVEYFAKSHEPSVLTRSSGAVLTAPLASLRRGSLSVWESGRASFLGWDAIKASLAADFPQLRVTFRLVDAQNFVAELASARAQGSLPDVVFVDNHSQVVAMIAQQSVVQMIGQPRFEPSRGWWFLMQQGEHRAAAAAFIRWLEDDPHWKPPSSSTVGLTQGDKSQASGVALKAILANARCTSPVILFDHDAGGHFGETPGTSCLVKDTLTNISLRFLFGNGRIAYGVWSFEARSVKNADGTPARAGFVNCFVLLRKREDGWKVMLLMPGNSFQQAVSLADNFDRLGLSPGKRMAPAAPTLLAPYDGEQQTRSPKQDIAWQQNNPLPAAYMVEYQYASPLDVAKNWSGSAITFVDPSKYSDVVRMPMPFGVGVQPHRWRIWAVGKDGQIALSEWRTVNFTN